jgi:hypothetical protein
MLSPHDLEQKPDLVVNPIELVGVVDVVLYRAVADLKLPSDLLVCETLDGEIANLTLAW